MSVTGAEKLGARVRMVRRRQGMTQKELAQLAGCSQQTIVDVETQNTRSKYLPAIARALGESLDWLETGQGGAHSAERLPHYDLWALAHAPTAPVDRLFADPVGDATYTVSVDAATAARSGGLLRELDALVCRATNTFDVARSWFIAWAPGWKRASVCRIAEVEGSLYLAPPQHDVADLTRPVRVTTVREEAAAADDGQIPTLWLCAEVIALVRQL